MNGYPNPITEPRQTTGRLWRYLAAMSILALVLLGTGRVLGVSTPANPAAMLRIGDGATNVYTVAPGQQITLPIEVIDAANLGAATVLLTYDPAVVRVVACTGPVSAGFGGGACNTSFALDAVKFNVISLQGVSGNHHLYDVTFEAVGADSTATDLVLTSEHFADPFGNDLEVNTTGGRIQVAGSSSAADVVLRVGDTTQNDFELVPGESLVVPINLDIAVGRWLGATSVLLRYDPQVLRPTHCARPPGVNDGMMGFCNPAFDPSGGFVKFNVMSDSGLSDALHAWDLTFEVASGVSPGAASDLVLIVEEIADVSGAAMSFLVVNGEVLVRDGTATSAQVLVDAPPGDGAYTLALSGTTSVAIWVADVTDLGAATLTLSFDPTLVRPLSCAVRTNGTGVTAGGCAMYEDHVRANFVSIGGIDGAVQLVDLVFTSAAAASPGASSPLALTVEHFADTAALPLPSRTRDGRIDITSGGGGAPVALVRVGDGSNGGAFDLPLDGEVDVQVGVQGIVGLGAATLSLQYDPAVVRPVSCTVGSAVPNGFCNLWAGQGTVRMNAISISGFNGDVKFFTVSFRAADGVAVGEEGDLILDVTNFDDIYGNALLYELAPGAISITPGEGNAFDVFLQAGDGPYYLAAGERVTISVQASVIGGKALGVATLLVEFDPTVIQPLTCDLNTDTAANGFEGGGCNPNFGPGQIKLNVLSTTGVAGSTTIAQIEFEAVGAVGSNTDIGLNVEHLADTEAGGLTYQSKLWTLNIAGPDNDGDGMPGSVEAGAPQNGDGNGDGVADAQQPNVTSLPNVVDGRYLTLVSPPGTVLNNVRSLGNPSPTDAPVGSIFPLGFLSFEVHGIAPGAAVVVEVFLPPVTMDSYHQYGPTPADPTNHWYEFSYNGVTGAEVLSDRVILHFVDGGRGDHDLTANGVIVDPGGVAETLFSASYTVSKVLTGHDAARTNQTVGFTITVTNTGDAPLTELSLSDHYDRSYLTFRSSNPPADDSLNDGVLNWSDLVAGVAELASGASISVDVEFFAHADTTALPAPQTPCQEGGKTCNTAIVDRAIAEPGGGHGPQSLGTQQAWDDIRIEQPTSVRMGQSHIFYADDRVVLRWETVDENNILAFNIYRWGQDGERTQLTDFPIVALMTGQSSGALYQFNDESVRLGETYQYELEVMETNGSTWRRHLGSVFAGEPLYLPLMDW